MERTMADELDWAARMVRGVFGERNPDVVADTVARYWYGIGHLGEPRGLMRLRWAWLKERVGCVFPGMGEGTGHRDAFRANRKAIEDIGSPARFPSPDWPVQVSDLGEWIEGQARSRSERLAVRAMRTGVNLKHASLRAGFSSDVLRRAFQRLRQRCRQAQPDCL